MMGRWVYVVLVISLILSLRNPKRFDTQTITDDELTHPSLSIFLQRSHFNISQGHELRLEYDYYRDKCPDAEKIVRSKMAQLYSQDKQVPANLLRLFFHDCFIMVYHFNLLVTILGFLQLSLQWLLFSCTKLLCCFFFRILVRIFFSLILSNDLPFLIFCLQQFFMSINFIPLDLFWVCSFP